MTVPEFYDSLASDYRETLLRLGNEGRVVRFLKKFASDPSFSCLKAAMEAEDLEESFRFAHTVKGIAMNLGLTALVASASALTEALRPKRPRDDLKTLFLKTEEDYRKAVAAIEALEAERGYEKQI